MSLNSIKLRRAAIIRCRELRQNQTPAEELFWEGVRNNKFNNLKFYRQYPIFFDYLGKETFYVADFYCHQAKLVIELDGGIHQKQKDKDNLRTEIIGIKGIKVLRFNNEEILKNINSVLKRIESQI